MNPIAQLKLLLDEHQIWETPQIFQRNAHIKVQGSIDTRIYFVQSGSIRVYLIDESEEHTIRFGYPGSFITALDSFVQEQPSPFYIQAIKQSEIWSVDKVDFMQLIHAKQEHLALWIDLMQALIVQQLEREHDLLTSSPLERYKRVLKRSPQVFQEVPNKYIASYLRMTPETLSRLKKS